MSGCRFSGYRIFLLLLLSAAPVIAVHSPEAWAAASQPSPPWQETAVLNKADFDGDSKPDLAVGSFRWPGYTIEIKFSSPVANAYLTLAEPGLGTRLLAYDIDHDSCEDLVVTNATSLLPVAVFLGDGKGHFQPGKPWLFLPLSSLGTTYHYDPVKARTILACLQPQLRYSAEGRPVCFHPSGLDAGDWTDHELEAPLAQRCLAGFNPRSPPALPQI